MLYMEHVHCKSWNFPDSSFASL